MPAKLSSPISPNCMFSFLFMNIAHLYAKYRQKNKLLADYCDSSTMFICLCKTFLHEDILDIEVCNIFLSHTTREDVFFLTDITLSDSIIIEAIKELSINSAGGPDGIPTSLLINYAEEIAPVLKNFFSHSLSSSLIPTSF